MCIVSLSNISFQTLDILHNKMTLFGLVTMTPWGLELSITNHFLWFILFIYLQMLQRSSYVSALAHTTKVFKQSDKSKNVSGAKAMHYCQLICVPVGNFLNLSLLMELFDPCSWRKMVCCYCCFWILINLQPHFVFFFIIVWHALSMWYSGESMWSSKESGFDDSCHYWCRERLLNWCGMFWVISWNLPIWFVIIITFLL